MNLAPPESGTEAAPGSTIGFVSPGGGKMDTGLWIRKLQGKPRRADKVRKVQDLGGGNSERPLD